MLNTQHFSLENPTGWIPAHRIYRSLYRNLSVWTKLLERDTASWVSWMSVSMNNYLEKFYLSGLSKYGMHTSRCLTDFMTYYVWHSNKISVVWNNVEMFSRE